MESRRRRLGRWALEERIGRGASAVVWRATDHDGNVAAVKVRARDGSRAEARLRRESETVAALDHPHIVRVHELLELDDEIAIVMELLAGPPLRQWAAEQHEAEVLRVFSGVLHAVDAVHRQGVVHRDLKPSNVLLTAEARPLAKVTDFGIARRDTDATMTVPGGVLGTPAYMAPEQVDDPHLAGPAADVFALGATLYELLCRRPPFGGGNPMQVLERARRGLYADPAVVAPTLSARTLTALGGSLAPDPTARIPDVGTLHDVLTGTIDWTVPPRGRATVTRGSSSDVELVGRDEIVTALRRELHRHSPVTLVGPIGVGKSAIARAVAAEWTERATVVDVSVATDDRQVMLRLADALGCAQPWTHLDQLFDAVGEALPSLTVIDGLPEVPVFAERLARWCAEGACVLVTAAAPLRIPGEHVREVEPLGLAEACRLLRRLTPALTATDAELTHLVERIGPLPLAIELLAGMLRESSAPHAEEGSTLAGHDHPLRRGVRRVLGRLGPTARATFAQLSVFEDGVRPDVAEHVVQPPDGAPLRPLLQTFRERFLLTPRASPAQPGSSRLGTATGRSP